MIDVFGIGPSLICVKIFVWKTFWLPVFSSGGCDTCFLNTVYKKRQLALLSNKPYRFNWELWASSSNSSEKVYIKVYKIIHGRSQCTLHRKSKQIFPEMKLRDFFIHVSVSGLYIPTIGPPILLYCDWWTDRGEYINHSQIHEFRNWERGRTVSFLGIFVFEFSAQCFCSASF